MRSPRALLRCVRFLPAGVSSRSASALSHTFEQRNLPAAAVLWPVLTAALGLLLSVAASSATAEERWLPAEPVEIGTTPQFFVDDYLVDNRWGIHYKRETVRRVFHAPRKHPANPLIHGDGGYANVARDPDTGLLRMWYQTSRPADGKQRTRYAVAYAESPDGLTWTRPNLGLCEFDGTRENNVVWVGNRGRASSVFLLDVPEEQRHGYTYLFLYRDTDGSHLVGSHDGIHWDPASDRPIQHLHSDTQNAIVYDPVENRYLMYCRAKAIYRKTSGEMLDTGASRRIARVVSPELWTDWPVDAQQILIPDELDIEQQFHAFYGMPVRYHAGLFWGFLWPFRWNDNIHTELAFSRDGARFDRLPDHPKLIERGPEGTWDQGMVFGSCRWIEMGDQWWFYYCGWDGPHGMPGQRTPGIGLATLRREGFVSLFGPRGGGVVCTRTIRWPGGELLLNACADDGELKVRISDKQRKVIEGFDYDDCRPLQSDSVAHRVAWGDRSLDELAGQVIRLEIYLRNAHLYTLRATGHAQ